MERQRLFIAARPLMIVWRKLNHVKAGEVATQWRSAFFQEQKSLQLAAVKRVEKIKVRCRGYDEWHVLSMNKDLSTPYACALHIGEAFTNRAAVASVNGKPWDMHCPLTEDCELELMHFQLKDPTVVNEAFWRSCAFVLGYIMETAFKNNISVELKEPVNMSVESGCFAYDVTAAGLDDWKPSQVELLTLSQIGSKLSYRKHEFEPLILSIDKAKLLFKHDSHKLAALEQSMSDTVSVYRMGSHVDMAASPLISNSSHIGRFTVAAVHKVGPSSAGFLYRVQGVALPTPISMHSWTYRLLVQNASHLATLDQVRSAQPAMVPKQIRATSNA